MTTLEEEHVHIGKRAGTNEPCIRGTGTSVRAVAELWLQGAQPEEISLHLPHITLGQIFDALSYYSDHKEEIDYFINMNVVPEELSGTSLS